MRLERPQAGIFLSDYLTLISGSVGRLVISLVYFLIAANVLSLADFGLFATASAFGVILARVAAFGFISPLFRAATVRPRVTGTYLAGWFALLVLSLPVMLALATTGYMALFRPMGALAFALVVLAEAVAWRLLEVVAIINNGMRRFGKAAALVLVGSAVRTLAALGFWLAGDVSLVAWGAWYLAANALSAVIAFAFFLPRLRLRFRPALYPRRMKDAVSAALADIVFYVQAELDKLVVLSLAGPRMAGLYAIAMRIIDLTAMPVRSFNQLVMQKAMVDRASPRGLRTRALNEAGIALVSVGALLGLIIVLWWKPDLLGRNIGQAASLFPVLLAVPALRNLTEYHAELLYAAERTGLRALLLGTIAALKAGLIAAAIHALGAEGGWPIWLNVVFLATYVLSASVTYAALQPRRTGH